MRNLLRAAALGIAVAATTVPALAQVYVNVAPPAPIVETRPVAPGSGYAWVPGYYRWNGSQYAWAHGHYMRPPGTGQVWVAGHWVEGTHGRWHWVEGHWRTV
jgi:hypothetical protein